MMKKDQRLEVLLKQIEELRKVEKERNSLQQKVIVLEKRIQDKDLKIEKLHRKCWNFETKELVNYLKSHIEIEDE